MATQANATTASHKPAAKTRTKSKGKAPAKPIEAPAEVLQATLVETMPVIPEQIVQLDLTLVDSNPYNTRRFHNEAELYELADSIQRHGILHPITVRQLGDRYQIVCGERRYLASIIAEVPTIAAVVRTLTDEQALEITLIENLQRKDITPAEESAAFCRLMDVRRASIADLVIYSGKSENYVRSRLQLRNLIEEAGLMLADGRISLGNALELSRYNQDIQQDVLNQHLTEGCYFPWAELKTPIFRQRLDQNYGTDLQLQPFDKAECTGCNFNSATYDLFACEGACGHCQNPTCLHTKAEEYRLGQVVKLAEENPGAEMVASATAAVSANLIEKLDSLGYEVQHDHMSERPEEPEAPMRENYHDDEEFAEAMEDYRQDVEEYNEEKQEFEQMVADGRARKVIDLSGPEPAVCYKMVNDAKEGGGNSSAGETAADRESERIIAELRAKEKRYREIAVEHSVDEVKKMMHSLVVEAKTFMPSEMAMLYFFLMNHTRRGHIEAIGGKNIYLSDEERHRLMSGLDETQQNIILRDYIHSKLLDEAYGDTIKGRLMLEFAAMHFPEETGNICRKYESIYAKRKEGIELRIAALQVDAAVTDVETLPEGNMAEDPESVPAGDVALLELAQVTGEDYPQTEATVAQAA